MPLDHSCFEQGGWGVGVVLKELWRVEPVVCEVEAAVDRRNVALPRTLDRRDGILGDCEIGEAILIDHELHGLETHLVEFVGRLLDLVDLAGVELVVSLLVPVGLVACGVEKQAKSLYFLPPAGTRRDRDSLHLGAAAAATA